MVKVLGARVVGPLESYASGLAIELSRQGYTANGATQHLCFIAHLSRWMAAAGLGISGLTPSIIEQYLASRRAAEYTNYRSAKALQPLLDYLASLGELAPAEAVTREPVDALLENWRRFLIGERGLTAATACGYIHAVRAFVVGRVGVDGLDLAALNAGDVTRFVLATCTTIAKGSAKLRITALRSLLNWLHVASAATSNCTRRGHFKRYQPERSGVFRRVRLGRGLCLSVSGRKAVLVEPVALPANLDQMRVVHQSIEECGNGGRVAEELGPIFERPV